MPGGDNARLRRRRSLKPLKVTENPDALHHGTALTADPGSAGSGWATSDAEPTPTTGTIPAEAMRSKLLHRIFGESAEDQRSLNWL